MEDNKYEFKLRILGNEIFAIALVTNNNNSLLNRGLLITFVVVTLLGAYGENIYNLIKLIGS